VQDEAVWRRLKGNVEKIIDTKDIALPGVHNRENVCAAVMAASLAGVSVGAIQKVVKTFRGLEHRLEFVADVNGVAYYDDSFSTTPETAIAAIQAFEAPKVLILGGSTKASDFSAFVQTIVESKQIRGIIGIGVEWQRIKVELEMRGYQ
jgi:UDP-N-acetylmuramoylalanine--D-glutamate ligase